MVIIEGQHNRIQHQSQTAQALLRNKASWRMNSKRVWRCKFAKETAPYIILYGDQTVLGLISSRLTECNFPLRPGPESDRRKTGDMFGWAYAMSPIGVIGLCLLFVGIRTLTVISLDGMIFLRWTNGVLNPARDSAATRPE